MTKLSVIVDEPVMCKNCCMSGWLTEHEFRLFEEPQTCLGIRGAGPWGESDRVVLCEVDRARWHDEKALEYRDELPRCSVKNADGDCSDFVRARPIKLRWWEVLLSSLPSFRQALRRRVRT